MKTKKLIALLLCCFVTLTFCGCGMTENFHFGNTTQEKESQTVVSNKGNGSISDSVKSETYNNSDPEDFDTYQKYYFEFLGEDVMPITNWVSHPSSMYSEKVIAEFAECGLNCFMQYGTGEEEYLLDLCEKYGIVALLWQTSAAKKNLSHPALAGAILGDEPGFMVFSDYYQTYLDWEKTANNRMLFVNLLGPGTDSRTLYYAASAANTDADWNGLKNKAFEFDGAMTPANADYDYYYRKAVELFSPKYLSSDFYTGLGSFPTVVSNYYENLSYMTRLAIDLNVPLFNYIQACGFAVYYRQSFRVPYPEDILWNVNASLAYGVKGFEYFCYYDPNSNANMKFTGSPIAQDGSKTQTWYSVQAANRYIAAADEWLINSKWQGIMHAGSSLCRVPEGDLLSSYGTLSSVAGEHVLVGCFDYLKGKECYYVINDSLTEETSVTLSFDSAQNLRIVDDAATETTESAQVSFNLKPAAAKLIVVE